MSRSLLIRNTFPRQAAMRQVMRQIGVVAGLTVVLTFPVTVVSGAGSQKQTDHVFQFAVGGKEQGTGAVVAVTKTERTRPPTMMSKGIVNR